MKIRILSLVCALALLLSTCGCQSKETATAGMAYSLVLDGETLYFDKSTVDPTNPQQADVGLWAYDTDTRAVTRLSKTRGYLNNTRTGTLYLSDERDVIQLDGSHTAKVGRIPSGAGLLGYDDGRIYYVYEPQQTIWVSENGTDTQLVTLPMEDANYTLQDWAQMGDTLYLRLYTSFYTLNLEDSSFQELSFHYPDVGDEYPAGKLYHIDSCIYEEDGIYLYGYYQETQPDGGTRMLERYYRLDYETLEAETIPVSEEWALDGGSLGKKLWFLTIDDAREHVSLLVYDPKTEASKVLCELPLDVDCVTPTEDGCYYVVDGDVCYLSYGAEDVTVLEGFS